VNWHRDPRLRGLLVAALMAVAFLSSLWFGDPGALFLIPVLLTGVFFGRWEGASVGILAAGLLAVAQVVADEDGGLTVFAATVAGLAVYMPLGLIVGWLSESRIELVREVRTREHELVELRTIQETLSPPEPEPRPGLELATCYLPAQDGVAGDFYLVTQGMNDATVIAIGDVAGRGLEAAKRAWFVRTVLASSADFTEDPGEMLDLANYSLIEESGASSLFVTAACIVYRPWDRTIRWSVAGHDSPMLLDEGKPLPNRPSAGVPLGIEDSTGCATVASTLAFGSGLLLYTDGVTEARQSNGGAPSALFGDERLVELISRLRGESPDVVVERVRDAVLEHTGGRLEDDLCLVALRVSPVPAADSVCPPDWAGEETTPETVG
jgi:serine phosphatase RsbU (regulator of sigma subunit)